MDFHLISLKERDEVMREHDGIEAHVGRITLTLTLLYANVPPSIYAIISDNWGMFIKLDG